VWFPVAATACCKGGRSSRRFPFRPAVGGMSSSNVTIFNPENPKFWESAGFPPASGNVYNDFSAFPLLRHGI